MEATVRKCFRVVGAAIAALTGMVGPALAQWHGPPGPYAWPHHVIPPVELMLVYPLIVPAPAPGVVYVPAAPLQAVPASDPFVDQLGRYCREYQANTVVNGRAQASYGTACRMPDGQWRIVG